jgi:hypothetical protein
MCQDGIAGAIIAISCASLCGFLATIQAACSLDGLGRGVIRANQAPKGTLNALVLVPT